jgi:hypothetical protein
MNRRHIRMESWVIDAQGSMPYSLVIEKGDAHEHASADSARHHAPADMTSKQGRYGACVAARQLRLVYEALASGAPIGVKETEWLAAGLRRYLDAAPAGLTLEAALGLSVTAGGSPWWRTERLAARDAAIRALSRNFAGSANARAVATGECIRRYQSAAWRCDRHNGFPSSSDRRRELLFTILSLDPNSPTSIRRLVDIIGSSYDLPAPPSSPAMETGCRHRAAAPANESFPGAICSEMPLSPASQRAFLDDGREPRLTLSREAKHKS